MGNTSFGRREELMAWKGVTVIEQRENFISDYRLGYYSVSELALRYGVSRKTGYKWIRRWEEEGRGSMASTSSHRNCSSPASKGNE